MPEVTAGLVRIRELVVGLRTQNAGCPGTGMQVLWSIAVGHDHHDLAWMNQKYVRWVCRRKADPLLPAVLGRAMLRRRISASQQMGQWYMF